MHIYVAQLWPTPQIVSEWENDVQEDGEEQSLLFIPIPRWANLSQLDNQVYELTRNSQRAFDGLIFKAHNREARILLGGDEETKESAKLMAGRLSFRLEGRPVKVLHWFNNGFAINTLVSSGVTVATDSESTDSFLLQNLRQAELISWTTQPGALLPAISECHYVGPNGSHYKSFLRVGVMTRSVDVLGSLAFWLLPYILPSLNSPILLLLDSWTILSVGLNVFRYLVECGYIAESSRGLVECLHNYDEDTTELVRRLQCLQDSAGGFTEILLVISVSSSRRLATNLFQLCYENGWPVRVVSLFACNECGDALGSAQSEPEPSSLESTSTEEEAFSATSINAQIFGEPLCFLGEEFQRYDRNSCPICQEEQSPLVRIQPSTYLLESTAALRPTSISMTDAKEANEFFGRYSDTGCVTVHRNQHDGSRHHMIHVDVNQLLQNQIFQERLRAEALTLADSIDVILSPNHETAINLAEIVQEVLGKTIVVCDPQHLSELDESEKATLTGTRILLVDDVVIAGNRLRSYRAFFQTGGFKTSSSELHLLVGVARPVSSVRLRGICDMVHGRDKFHAVERLLLPNWDERDCPWCKELKEIETAMEVLDEVRDSAEMAKRYQKLRQLSSGLIEGLFLHWQSAEINFQQLQLGAGSVFQGRNSKPLSQVEIFVAVACALQHKRDSGHLNETFTTPVAKVLEPAKYTIERYYDRIIPACVLRATHQHDLRATKTDSELITYVNSLFADDAYTEFRSELLFAIARGLLPRAIDEVRVAEALENGDPGVGALFRSLLT